MWYGPKIYLFTYSTALRDISDLTRFCYRDDILPNASLWKTHAKLSCVFLVFTPSTAPYEKICVATGCIRNNACLRTRIWHCTRICRILKKDCFRSSFVESVDCFMSKYLRSRMEYISLEKRTKLQHAVNMMRNPPKEYVSKVHSPRMSNDIRVIVFL